MDRGTPSEQPRLNGTYSSQTLPNRQAPALTQAQAYRLQESEYASGNALPSPSSTYEERFDSPGAMTPGANQPSWSSPTQPLHLRPRPDSGASRGTSGPHDDDTSISTRDEMSPPPDYSTTDPALLMRKRTMPSGNTALSGGPPRLPDMISDIKSISLFDGDGSNRNSSQSGDWSFLAGYTDEVNLGMRSANASNERQGPLATIPGSRNVSGSSTVRDLRHDISPGTALDGDARVRYERGESYGMSSPNSAVGSTLGSTRASYEDELRGESRPSMTLT
jgi:hypothetical protein